MRVQRLRDTQQSIQFVLNYSKASQYGQEAEHICFLNSRIHAYLRSSHVSRDLFFFITSLSNIQRCHCITRIAREYYSTALDGTVYSGWQLKWTPHYCLFTHAFTLISMGLRLIKIHLCLFTLQSVTNHDRHHPADVYNGIPGVAGLQTRIGFSIEVQLIDMDV